MADWDGELRNLASYLERIKGSASRLEGELQKLLEAQENIAALMYSRRALEVVVADLCESKLGRPRGTAPLLGILDEFDRKAKKESVALVPKHILASMRHLNEIGALAAHPYDFSIQQIREALIALSTVLEWYVTSEKPVEPARHQEMVTGNPYLGLEAFQEEDADRFFGREALTLSLWEQCRELHEGKGSGRGGLRFLAIHGPSGSGKSSLARAGLLPEIARHPWEPLQAVQCLTLTPGHHPTKNLGRALARLVTGDAAAIGKAREFAEVLLSPDGDGLADIAEALSATVKRPLMLLVDQFEEVYTLCDDPQVRQAFIDNLLDAAADPAGHVFVLITLRSDFLGETQAHPRLNQAIAEHDAFVPAMDEEGLRRAICEPARLAGHPLDEATVELLIEQSAGREGVLPLLQFALTGIWEGLKNGTPAATSLSAMGGVGGALAQKAQALYEELPAGEQAIARRVFLQLIRLGEGARDTRRRAGVDTITAHDESSDTVRAVLNKLSRPEARLITLTDDHGRTQAEITHEALLEHWGSLQEWLAESRADLRFAERLNEAVRHWQAHRRAKGLLWWQAPDYDLLETYQHHHSLTSGQMALYRASRGRRRMQRAFKLGLVAILAALTVVSSAAAFWAMHAEEQALEAKNRALKQKELALEAINAMTYGLADKLAPLPRSGPIVAEILKKNVALLDRIYALDPDAREALREKAVNLERAGDQWLELGNVRAALDSYRQTLVIREKLARDDPGNAQVRRDLSIGHNRIGDVQLRLGDTRAALDAYRVGLQIAEKLAHDYPDNIQVQRDLSVTHNRNGHVLLQLGDTKAALDAYLNGLKIAQKLASDDPENAEAKRDLAVSHEYIGYAHLKLNDTGSALSSYQRSFEVFENLARDNPENTEAQRSLSVSYNKIGDIKLRLGNTQAALDIFRESLAIAEKLARDDPDDTQAQRDLSISHERIGDVQLQLGDTSAALAAYQHSLAIREKLARDDQDNTQAQRDLSISHDRIGDVQLKLGDTKAALAVYRQSLHIREKLARDDPENAEARLDLSISHERIGDAQLSLGDTEAALGAYRQTLDIRERLAQVDPENAQAQRDLSVGHNKIGDVQLKGGDTKAALDSYREGLKIAEKLARVDPNNAEAQRDLMVSYYNLGTVHDALNDGEAALDFFRQALSIAQALARDTPNWQAQNDLKAIETRIAELQPKQTLAMPPGG